MKLTWFGGTTMRVHIGGSMIVVDAASAPAGIAAAELVSGADRVVESFGSGLPVVELLAWKPRRAQRVVDETDENAPVEIWWAADGVLLVDAEGEMPLVLAQTVPEMGRWAREAVLVVFGDGGQLTALGQGVLQQHAPRLLGLAGDEAAMDEAIPALRDLLDGTGLVALQAGLALEV